MSDDVLLVCGRMKLFTLMVPYNILGGLDWSMPHRFSGGFPALHTVAGCSIYPNIDISGDSQERT